jgi:hypothetical protein
VSSLTRAEVADLLQRADDLLADADNFPDNTPNTTMAAASLVDGDQGPIGSWYVRDRKYQADLPKLDLNRAPHDLVATVGDLSEFEQFAYSAVVAVAGSCNENDARLNLKVAHAFLDEAHRDFHGEGSDDWSPPDITNEETGANQCSDE